MVTTDKRYCAKILLFGEYSLLHGSMAVTIPFHKHQARWCFPAQPTDAGMRVLAIRSNKQLTAYRQFLVSGDHPCRFHDHLRLDAFGRDLAEGAFLYSNIPSGYGLGSSGALVAAVYDRYKKKDDPDTGPGQHKQAMQLKELFAGMESFFHGQSSGIDPLAAYLGKPLLTGIGGRLSFPSLPANDIGKGFFLIDTRIPRKTADMVSVFATLMKRRQYAASFLGEYTRCNDRCIKALLSGDPLLGGHIRQLSQYQWELFREMIPGIFRPAWEGGLKDKQYALKLCGAGGGGFLLGHTDDYARASAELGKKHIRLMPLPTG